MLQAALVGAGVVVLASAGVAATARRRLTVVMVDGESMSPALRSGDQVLVARSPAVVSVGDVVVFRYASGPDERLIKRVAAVAGDLVPQDVLRAVGAESGTRVPQGFLVVIGDGAQSTDSRDFGYLPADRVTGVVLRRLSGSGRRAAIPARAGTRPVHGVTPSGSRPDAAP